jgi:hypothetical protein
LWPAASVVLVFEFDSFRRRDSSSRPIDQSEPMEFRKPQAEALVVRKRVRGEDCRKRCGVSKPDGAKDIEDV